MNITSDHDTGLTRFKLQIQTHRPNSRRQQASTQYLHSNPSFKSTGLTLRQQTSSQYIHQDDLRSTLETMRTENQRLQAELVVKSEAKYENSSLQAEKQRYEQQCGFLVQEVDRLRNTNAALCQQLFDPGAAEAAGISLGLFGLEGGGSGRY